MLELILFLFVSFLEHSVGVLLAITFVALVIYSLSIDVVFTAIGVGIFVGPVVFLLLELAGGYIMAIFNKSISVKWITNSIACLSVACSDLSVFLTAYFDMGGEFELSSISKFLRINQEYMPFIWAFRILIVGAILLFIIAIVRKNEE